MPFSYRTPIPCKNILEIQIQAEIVNYAACMHLHILLSDLEGGIFGIQDWTKIFGGFTKMLASHTDDLLGLSQVPAPGTSADTRS